MSRPPRKTRAGFTIIELMVVVAIISILVVFLVAGFSRLRIQAAQRATRALILQLEQGCERFRQAYGFYPPDATGTADTDPGWSPGDPPPWNDDERCIMAVDAHVDPPTVGAYIGILEFVGLANPSDTVEPIEALVFCLLLEKKGGPFVQLAQRLLANRDDDTYQPYLDEDNDGERVAGEDVGSPRPLLEIVDPWGTALRYLSPAGRNDNVIDELRNPHAVQIYAAGPNKVFGEDDGEDNDNDGQTDEPGELDEDDLVSGEVE